MGERREIKVIIGPIDNERIATEIMIEIEDMLRTYNVGGVFDEKEWSDTDHERISVVESPDHPGLWEKVDGGWKLLRPHPFYDALDRMNEQ